MLSKCLLAFCVLTVLCCQATAATETILHSFNALPNGAVPLGGLVADNSGVFYGEASSGGAYGHGAVYELIPNTQGGWSESVIYSFKGGSDGSLPLGNLVFDASGTLYGLTQQGGSTGCTYNLEEVGCGTLFKLTPAGGRWTESVLYRFSPAEGGLQLGGSLVFDAAGNLYSVTGFSTVALGAIFQLSASGGQWTYALIHAFTGGTDGAYPNSPLLVDKTGNVYGTAMGGGASNHGVAFEFTPAGDKQWAEAVLYNFTGGSDGGSPRTGLTPDRSGNFYGGTAAGGTGCSGAGCGVVFELTPGSDGQYTENVLYNFQNVSVAPNGLVFDNKGNLFGSSFAGGDCYQCGTVFELSMVNGQWQESRVWKFKGADDGEFPSLLIVNAGQIFGTSFAAGASGNGTVFQLTPGTGATFTETTIYDFPYGKDGDYPETRLISDAAGNLYGTTGGGGPSDHGVVFELVAQPDGSWKEKILYNFPGTEAGMIPNALTFDAAGNLFGTTAIGKVGDYGGTVFELSPTAGGWTGKYIYQFEPPDGAPNDLIFDQAGNIFVAAAGGNLGEILELTLGSDGKWTSKVIYKFKGYPNDGAFPTRLTLDSLGNLYGTTIAGGNSNCRSYVAGCGTVFELSPNGSGWTETLLYQFTGTGGDGSDPEDGVMFDAAGNLYGTTAAGGSHLCIGGCGTVYELSPVAGGGWSEKVLYKFSNSGQDGNTPFGNVIFDAQGNLYGTTFDGGGSSACGTYGCGTVFKLTPIGGDWSESIVNNFGAYPGDARNPRASLVLDPAGNLYGTSQAGGRAAQGTVFRIQP